MTEAEKKAIERINNILFDDDKSSLYIEIFKDDARILLNLIQKQDNVIDDLCNDISKHWVENPNEIKQRYFMKEDK